MVMAALILAVMTVGLMILHGVIYTIMAIPILVLLLIGYALVIKDHLEKKRKRDKRRPRSRAKRRKRDEEE